MSPILAGLLAIVMYLLVRLLHLTTPSSVPLIYVKDYSSQFVQSVLTLCPILQQSYNPPLLWGKSGHAQTIAYAKMGRVNIPVVSGVRHTKVMADGSTVIFDLYKPTKPHPTGGSYCVLICPGIGNSSESSYMRTLVNHTQRNGYTTVVLNHLGALKDVRLTSARIFTYGGTEELATVRAELEHLQPGSPLILVGCSMGANIVVKYLGECPRHQQGVLAAVSLGQGYDVNKAKAMLTSWENLRYCYMYMMTWNQKQIIKRHKDQLLSAHEKNRIGGVNEAHVFSAQIMSDIDEAYTRRRFGFDSLEEFYHHNSSCYYLNKVDTPLLIVNAEDDPIVPAPLLEYPLQASRELPNCMFVLTKHGGHLGFFEQGVLRPNSVTWMDRLIVEFADAVVTLHNNGSLPKASFVRDSAVPEAGSATEMDIGQGEYAENDAVPSESSKKPAAEENEVESVPKRVGCDAKGHSFIEAAL